VEKALQYAIFDSFKSLTLQLSTYILNAIHYNTEGTWDHILIDCAFQLGFGVSCSSTSSQDELPPRSHQAYVHGIVLSHASGHLLPYLLDTYSFTAPFHHHSFSTISTCQRL